jgi:predicted O-methyltransferase YrrM
MQPLAGHYETIRGGSSESARFFEDGSVDFVFIDADHVYDRVKEDILAWLPKVKPGGIIAGHDYNAAHQGVLQAVPEIFGTKVVPIPSDDFDHEHRPFYSWKVQL